MWMLIKLELELELLEWRFPSVRHSVSVGKRSFLLSPWWSVGATGGWCRGELPTGEFLGFPFSLSLTWDGWKSPPWSALDLHSLESWEFGWECRHGVSGFEWNRRCHQTWAVRLSWADSRASLTVRFLRYKIEKGLRPACLAEQEKVTKQWDWNIFNCPGECRTIPMSGGGIRQLTKK